MNTRLELEFNHEYHIKTFVSADDSRPFPDSLNISLFDLYACACSHATDNGSSSSTNEERFVM